MKNKNTSIKKKEILHSSGHKKHKLSLYWKLFYSTLSLSAFTIGGGYVIIPLMQKKFVEHYQWLTQEEMLNYVAIGQSAPGVIAINVSILVGHGIAGLLGAFITVLGTILPPMVIIAIVFFFYNALHDNLIFQAVMFGLQCGVAAVIVDTVIQMAMNIFKTKDRFAICIMVVSLIAAIVFQINVVWILLACIGIGVISTALKRRKQL